LSLKVLMFWAQCCRTIRKNLSSFNPCSHTVLSLQRHWKKWTFYNGKLIDMLYARSMPRTSIKIFNVFLTHEHGRRTGRGLEPLGFWNLIFSYYIFSKEGCSLSFKWVKLKFTIVDPPWKNIFGFPWKNLLLLPSPLEEILPTSMHLSIHSIRFDHGKS